MATTSSVSCMEGQSSNRPPLFTGSNYSHWKNRMKIFIQSTDYDLWKIVAYGPIIPTKKSGEVIIHKVEDEWSNIDKHNIEKNFKAMNLLLCAITPSEYDCVSACESAKEIWDKLEMSHEGDSQVKESKIDILVHSYELFKMKPYESISQMFARFANITNGLKALGKTYTQSEMTRKVLRSMSSKWDTTTSIILQSNDFSTYTMDKLMGSLMTEEMHHNLKDEDLAFKSATSKSKGKENEVANLCLMAIEDQEVDLDSTYSFDELLVAYKELKVVFEKVVSKNKVLKNIAKELSNEMNDLIDEKNALEEENENLKNSSNTDFLNQQIKDLIEEKDFLAEENESLKISLERERDSLKNISKKRIFRKTS